MEKINAQVAQRIRSLRRERGLSLEELATRSGVSRAMLSHIETLKANPTIAVLWKVAAGLDVPFAQVVEVSDGPAVRLSRGGEARYLHSEDGQFKSRPLLSNVPGHQVELYQLELQPGAVVDAEAHPGGSHEQLIVSSGRVELTVHNQSYELAAGDALLFPADTPHRYRTLGRRAFCGYSLILYR